MFLIKKKHLEVGAEFVEHGILTRVPPFSATILTAITPRNVELGDKPRWFSAIIDTGFSENLSIDSRGFESRVAYPIGAFRKNPVPTELQTPSDNLTNVFVYDCTLWIRPEPDTGSPYRIDVNRGFHYLESRKSNKALHTSLFGCAALSIGALSFVCDYAQKEFSLIHKKEKLGDRLVRKNIITPEILVEALLIQTERRMGTRQLQLVNEHRRLARILHTNCGPDDCGHIIANCAEHRKLLHIDDVACAQACSQSTEHLLGEVLIGMGQIDESDLNDCLGD